MAPNAKQRYALSRAGLTPFEPPVSFEEADRRAARIVEQMSAEEKFDMVCGRGFYIGGCERVGLPDINFTDATQGVHLREQFPAGRLWQSVCFPSALMLTCTWNRTLIAEYARAVGEECRAGGIHVLLGPGMNTYRIAQCGRNFEYTGEDPHLAAQMIYLYVTAVQQTGVIATLKHFVANETDYRRKLSNSIVIRQVLKEIYLPAFRSGVEAGALAVMTAYNQLNGEYCGESASVINGMLRGELGFRHLVMTDWSSVTDGELVANSGQDLEMPYGACLKAARETLLGTPEIDRMVRSIVRTFAMMGFLDHDQEQRAYLANLPLHEDVAYRVACEGTILLRNDGLLPLEGEVGQRIIVTGNWATRTPIAGKGSGYVEGYDNESYADVITERFAAARVLVRNPPSDADLRAADTVIVCTGFGYEGEGGDRPFELPDAENDLIDRASRLARRVVVVVTSGGGVAMEWHDSVNAVVQAPFGGQAGAQALAAVLSGDVNPSGRLAFTIEQHFSDSPGAAYLPPGASAHDPVQGGEPGSERPDHITGSWPYEIPYDEGSLVGYRWYDAKQRPVRYWFGHGLSYTTFSYADLTVAPRGEGLWKVSVAVTNTGGMEGAEVVQLYVEHLGSDAGRESPTERPRRELKAFDKVLLDPEETRTVRLLLSAEDLAAAPGGYLLHVGSSYADIRLKASLTV